jgi:transposase-like protein
MGTDYQVVDVSSKLASRELAEFLAKDGQLLLPLLDLVTQGQRAIDEVIDVMGRATIEAILRMSAEEVAGLRQQGKATDRPLYWHGTQPGRVALAERQVRVAKPRLRKRQAAPGEQAEVEIPAYEALRKDQRLADRMLSILMRGVSTRNYREVLPEMAEQVGVSKSQVSRENIEAGERLLKELAERDFSQQDLLIIYIDGLRFGDYVVVAAVGVDVTGQKHVLALREGATENAEVVKSLLEDLVARGVKPGRRRLFVIDGAKALRAAIDQVYGTNQPVQRCRQHKLRNVLGHLPKDQHDQARSTLKAAWKLTPAEGMAKLRQYAEWLERQWPSAAGSLREGLEEMFTVNRLELPASLRRCLCTTNLIDSTDSGVRQRTRRVTNWQNGSMVLRWAAAGFVETEKNYRRIMGYQQLWMLKAALDECLEDPSFASERKCG